MEPTSRVDPGTQGIYGKKAPKLCYNLQKKQLSSARIDSASEREVKLAVKAQPRSNSSVSPVLKVTGRPEGGVAPPIRHIDQFALKVANGRVMKERRFRPQSSTDQISPVTEVQTSEPPPALR